jgi:hypothetical protein
MKKAATANSPFQFVKYDNRAKARVSCTEKP